VKKLIEKATSDFKQHYNQDNWSKKVANEKSNIEVVSLQGIITEASEWIFSGKAANRVKSSDN
jgi:hypothetical protein